MDFNQIHYRTINGLKIRYREHVRPGAPCLLMTNAWPQSIRCWDSTWVQLGRDFHLLAFDMPGFGLSEGSPSLLKPSAQATFFASLLDAFNIDRIHGIGPDVGVPAMLYFAKHYPERVNSLVIFDGPGYYPPAVSWEIKAIVTSQAMRTLLSSFGNVFAFEAMRRGYRKFRPSQRALSEYRKVNSKKGAFPNTLNYLASYPEELRVIGESLDKISTSVLILWGEDDPFLSPRNAQELHRRIPKSELRILSGCGHFAQEDAGDEFVSIVQNWIKRQGDS